MTLTDIWEFRSDKFGNKGPLYPFDEATQMISDNFTGSWYLDSSIYIIGGSKLVLRGSKFGGDCDHLLLASNPSKFINLRAHGGDLWIQGTHVESWDVDAGTVDDNFEDGRRCVVYLVFFFM